ncbi:4-alpha-glucanotransferase [Arsenicicoccus piscis]|uniref:4-alpha-glucanotransferase n=1 Tax=Arsenicicoccus piscis TaxID=673954 RepID=A0ABQ6HLV7_9MICO|nr:4-alpha-glucanotransferase [Arsenicicoccus piscis]GMA18674.1 4-alpha-glucanotransferase [Arsenicicoccus piscis]
MTDAPSSALIELARLCGVATEYWDWQGRHVDVPSSTIRSVLTALGQPASTEPEVQSALARLRDRDWRRTLPPVVVMKAGESRELRVHVPHGAGVSVTLYREDGVREQLSQVERWVEPRMIDGAQVGEATFTLPSGLPLGWHRIEARLVDHTVDTTLVVTPDRLTVPDSIRQRPASGIMTQLYAVRSRRSWGMGDFADLADLGAWAAADLGADFVLVNPVHAAEPVAPVEPSPYLPTTRRFISPLYIRVEDIPEVGYMSAQERQLLQWHADDARRLNDDDVIDRDASWEHKDAALRIVYRQPRPPRRERALDAFIEREGQGLLDFATWCAIAADRHSAGSAEGEDGPDADVADWPQELRDPAGRAVAAKREELGDEIRYYCWLQWIADDQLAAAQRACREAGMRIGVMHDLAVGVHPTGADAWALRDALARDVTVGAPADQYNQLGQDWSQPPWRPDSLAEAGYAPYRDMLRTVLRSAGALRVDHIIGLFRLWWIPAGAKPFEGTYVRYDHDALIGILALEAHRAGALVIGEDLGTVEPWVRDYLKDRGILGTSILWFEKDADGRPLRPEAYRTLCLATVTTHDLPPTAGYLEHVHVDLRHELGLLTRDLDEEVEFDRQEQAEMLEVLRQRGLLRAEGDEEATIEALHKYLAWTPALLRGISVSDLAGDTRIINQPGTDEEYPNWRLPLAGHDGTPLLLDDLVTSPWARRLARCVR